MASRARLLILAVSTPLVGLAIVGGVLGRASAGQSGAYRHLHLFDDVIGLITSNYVEEVELDKVMDGAMRGLAEGLDADSAYFKPAEVVALDQPPPPGETGIELTRQFYLRVIAVRDGSPAKRAGLATGDYVRAIDGSSTRTMSAPEGRRALRGAPGSKVVLSVIRGSAAEPHEVTLVREVNGTPNVESRLERPGIGYLRVRGFDAKTTDEVRARLADLKAKGASRLILDLRSTALGDLMRGVDLARLFIGEGPLASRETRGKAAEVFSATSGDGAESLPLVTLTSNGTAGAAELVAAAFKHHARAEIIGERTLGRAGEQRLVRLPDGSGLWMTYAKFQGPSDEIHGKGVEPTIEVAEPEVEFGEPAPATDPILERALTELAAKMAA
jgi:carboxyl-terminal processing protease